MRSSLNDDKNDCQASNDLASENESEDTSGFFDSSSTLNNEKSYKTNAPAPSATNANERLRSRMQVQQVSGFIYFFFFF